MNKNTIYDKVSWHFPEGQSLSINSAKNHFVIIMNWFADRQLLNSEGKEIYDIGVDSDFALTSSMFTSQGNELMQTFYSEWIKRIDGKTDKEKIKIWEELVN